MITFPLYTQTDVKPQIETEVDDFNDHLKKSGYWLIDHIEIDANNPLLTWEVINQTYEWCTGKGTIDDPFIIENVSVNAINYNTGISISGSKGIYFIIKNNKISNSSVGIKFDTSDDGAIINNTISNNNETGILIHNCKRTNVIGNIIQNNTRYGVHLNGPNSKSNNIYKNHFIENGKHALDDSKPDFNSWYNSSVGNYWDNYTGRDANDDNIGDIPYNYIFGDAHSQDIYPTWWDPPSLIISSPINNSYYGTFAPDFKAIIDEGKGHSFWYEIAGRNSSFLSLLGVMGEEIIDVFEQELWDDLSNGTHKIRFYVNDSKGFVGNKDILIKTIIPSLNNWWDSSYTYRVPLKLVNMHTKDLPIGYSVNVSINTVNLISAGKLRNDGNDLRIVWYNATGDTWVELDRVNETNFNSIDTRIWFKTQASVRPNTYDGSYYLYYGCTDCIDPPAIGSKIYDFFDDFTQPDGSANGWTVINGTWSVNNTEYAEYKFQVDGRSLLNAYTIKNASIEIRINSTGGNFGAGIMFRHQNNQNFYTAGIGFWEYEVAIGKWTNDDPYVLGNTSEGESVLVDGQWYDLKIDVLGSNYLVYLDGLLKNNVTDSDHLNAAQIGLMTWTMSAVSTFDDLKIRLLVSNEPLIFLGTEETFIPQINYIDESADPLELGNNLSITVNVTDPSGINQVLIEFDGDNHTMIHIGGDLWQNDSWIPASTGNYSYTIYCQNNNLKWNFISGSIQVIDTTAPTFSDLTESEDPLELGNTEIISIKATDLSGINQVLIDVGGHNYSMTFMGGDVWQNASWIPNSIGIKTYTIYIEDNNKNWNSTSGFITVEDTIYPNIKINTPYPDQLFGVNSPSFNVEILDKSLDKMWYTLDINPAKHFFETNNSIDQTVWTSLSEGYVTITFYANDSAGNINSLPIDVIKDISKPTIEINTPRNNTYWKTRPPINITVFDPHFDTIWYRVGAIDISLINNTEQLLDTLIWDSLSDELQFTIYFYANDSAGNINSDHSFTLYKDVSEPLLTVNLPADGTYWNIPPDIQVTVSDPNFDSVWYVADGTKIMLSNGVAEPLDASIWDGLTDEASFTIDFYANDSAGNINSDHSFTLYKDISEPSVTVNLPADGTYWNSPPEIQLIATDPYFDSVWYVVDGIKIMLSNGISDPLDTSIWDSLPDEAPFTIYFYANDSAGNINSDHSFTLYKDISKPSVTVNLPADGTYWNSPPEIQVTATDPNFDSVWYVVDGTKIMLSNGVAEPLDASIWDGLTDEASFIINFYANDTTGNINSDYSFTLYKDISKPSIIVHLPADGTYWNAPPDIQVTVTDPNFDSVWYVVDGTKIMLISGVVEPLDTSIWDSLPDEAPFTIYFYANDSAGNINNDHSFMLYKDVSEPSIIVNLPADGTYWNVPPDIQVTVMDPNFDSVWYVVDGIKIMLSNGVLDPLDISIWDSLPDESSFIINFYANDSAGNINSVHSFTLYKDVSEPSIIVDLPADGTYWNAPPDIQVTVTDPNFDS
ncbi:MAG: NosD domain-containing protein, partial [Candidatus Hermodarchaeota archaeon]